MQIAWRSSRPNRKARRDEEVRVRADVKADEVIAALDEVRRILTRTIQFDGTLMPRDPERHKAVRWMVAEVRARAPIYSSRFVAILRPSSAFCLNRMSCGREASPRVRRDSTARCLRGEPAANVPDDIAQAERDLEALNDHIEAQIERQIAEDAAKHDQSTVDL
ncbi:hypothetical protein [Cellulomonas dongxiuzhuiae]|uniref:Uncharacterized protein n=1 Tax=Cellulomonas dongxiuzhuiae TaxID=2819979 RepID=A0ABX8GLM6_9CELL|nr:hypothetical protein [Cellulomonas dongxiuzhuiae]MBO3096396.1 hypothetical protein [Cellulomonas dongxiuzhuiae]QWC16805.1 hypothetical protein KKR89_03965 [Cellulomonas dongxiuzhuiae]